MTLIKLAKNKYLLFLRSFFASCFLLGLSLPAVTAQPNSSSYEVFRIGVEQGLSHRIVYDVLEDRQGYMWFATREGLNRYDGHRFVSYTHFPGDSLSIPDSKVRTVFESSNGTLWVGSEGGLVRFDRSDETFHRIPFPVQEGVEFISDPINSITETPDGTIWTITETRRLFRLSQNSSRLEYFAVTVNGESGQLNSARIRVDHSGQIVLSCQPTASFALFLGRLDPKSGQCSTDYNLTETGGLTGIGFTSDGSTIGSASLRIDSGHDRIQVLRWKGKLIWSATLDANKIQNLAIDEADRIWLATRSGVFLVDATGSVISHFTHSETDHQTLSDNRTNAITITRNGSVWIASEDGLTVFVPAKNPFHIIRHRPGDRSSLGDPRVNAILETLDGSLWVGTSNGLFKRELGSGNFEAIALPDVPGAAIGTQTRIWSLIEEVPGEILIGTAAAGVYRLDTVSKEVRHIKTPNILVAAQFGSEPPSLDRLSTSAFIRDNMGSIWMSTLNAVLRIDSLRAFSLEVIKKPNPPGPERFVNIILPDSRGQYWAGNNLGLLVLDEKKREFRAVGKTGVPFQGPSYPAVWSLAESPLTPDAIWIGTIGGGLNRYDVQTGRFTWYTKANGLPSNGIYGLLVDSRGLIWMSTTNGLARFNPLTEKVERFSRHDGLHDDDFDLLAYHKGQISGKMWFGGPTGLTEFHPDSVLQKTSLYRVNISGISIFDRPYPGIVSNGDTLKLDNTQNTLGFRFSAPDLLYPNDVAYRYKLVGYDVDWRINEAAQPEATYTQIPPGSYVFEVQADTQNADIIPITTSLLVFIEPAYWQTDWFQFISIVFAISLFGWGIWTVQSRRGKQVMDSARREIELKRLLSEREEHERGRLAREIHDGPIQTLYSVNHRLEEATPETLTASRRDVKELASELRSICEHLRPALVDNLGLEGALRARARTLSKNNLGLKISISFDSTCSALTGPIEHACYRIVQEALNNIIRHAEASKADISLSRNLSVYQLVIQDNGRGFDLPKDWLKLVRDSHFGLVGIRERAEMQGGSCRIDSAPGKGTRIEVEFPMESTMADA